MGTNACDWSWSQTHPSHFKESEFIEVNYFFIKNEINVSFVVMFSFRQTQWSEVKPVTSTYLNLTSCLAEDHELALQKQPPVK